MNITEKARTTVVGLAVMSLCGCASIMTSGDRKISVSSNPSAANLIVYDSEGTVVATSITPTAVKLKKGSGYFKGADYKLVLEKSGYQRREFEIKHDINGWYWGNFFGGGLLGFVVVDPLTGGMWVLKPDKIEADLISTTGPKVSLNEPALVVVTKDQLTPEQQQRLVPLPTTAAPALGR